MGKLIFFCLLPGELKFKGKNRLGVNAKNPEQVTRYKLDRLQNLAAYLAQLGPCPQKRTYM